MNMYGITPRQLIFLSTISVSSLDGCLSVFSVTSHLPCVTCRPSSGTLSASCLTGRFLGKIPVLFLCRTAVTVSCYCFFLLCLLRRKMKAALVHNKFALAICSPDKHQES
ncbi:hypothetical protein M9H77_25406 [Catharanthus roseus]|uniref:Uncharacterized protein n=1 Tax=Catharanthus roseus TaxID=4058 RepID=A0ACC0A9D6_CATRO|nr:hypothetical protein M9H77_25406 [Catharanthus roseus]